MIYDCSVAVAGVVALPIYNLRTPDAHTIVTLATGDHLAFLRLRGKTRAPHTIT